MSWSSPPTKARSGVVPGQASDRAAAYTPQAAACPQKARMSHNPGAMSVNALQAARPRTRVVSSFCPTMAMARLMVSMGVMAP